jgi:hypothetical protein
MVTLAGEGGTKPPGALRTKTGAGSAGAGGHERSRPQVERAADPAGCRVLTTALATHPLGETAGEQDRSGRYRSPVLPRAAPTRKLRAP